MKLGILIKNDSHLQHVVGLALAAINKKHDVFIFVMGEGTRLLQVGMFLELTKLERIFVSFCGKSANEMGVNTKNITANVIKGSQLNNAMKMHEADKVIAF